jgi:hypothetical protein
MALMDFIKKQFIDVIHWTEDDETTLAYRFPMQDMEIQYGAQLTVRESQMAAFVNEGQVADVFGPGRVRLTTQTIPLLTNLRNWDKLFQSPFKSDVYFFSTRLKVDQKWGTPNAITIRDKEFGAVRLRAFGIYSYRIVDAKAFHVNVSGTRERYGVDELSGQLRSTIVGAITDLFAESQIPFLDMAANQDEFANQLRAKAGGGFKAIGLSWRARGREPRPEDAEDPRPAHRHGDGRRYAALHPVQSRTASRPPPRTRGLAERRRLATGGDGQAMTQAIGGDPAAGATPGPRPRNPKTSRSSSRSCTI